MNWHRYIRTALVVASVLFILFICFNAGAATLKGNKESCSQLGNVVMQAADMRDSGISWDTFKPRLDAMLTEARGNPESFVQTDEDAKFVTKSMKLVWDNPDDLPFIVATAVYKVCMGK